MEKRQDEIKNAFIHSYTNGYAKYAYGTDEFHPNSKTGSNGFYMGLTIIDSLDMLYM